MWLALAMMFKCVKLLADTMDWEMIEVKICQSISKKRKKKGKKSSDEGLLKPKHFNIDFLL